MLAVFRLVLLMGLFFLGQGSVAQESSLPILKVYINSLEPYAYNKDGLVIGKIADKIRNYLNKSDLKYEIEIVPWKRAFTSVTTLPRKKNSLIGFFDRIPSREDDFIWLTSLVEKTNHLISRNTQELKNLTHQEIIEGNFKAVCLEASSQCGFLREFGFPTENIWQISESSQEVMVNLVIRGRADFFVDDFSLVKIRADAIGYDTTKIAPIAVINQSSDYLAGSKDLDPRILEKLQKIK